MKVKPDPKSAPRRSAPTFLVPTDFSECGLRATEHAARLGASQGARLLLLHVADTHALGSLAEGAGVRELRRAMRAAAGEKLRALKKRMGKGIHVQTYLREGRAWQEIVKFAQRAWPELIIMGSHGYTGLKHLALGSTAERVVRHAPCSVLIIRDRYEPHST
jgi:nucleotide-binding universal stress UspA family protein